MLGDRNPGTSDAMGIALNIDTGGHIFQIFFTSSQWHNEAYILANNRHRFWEGEFRFGFNVADDDIGNPRTHTDFDIDSLGIGQFRVAVDNNRKFRPLEAAIPPTGILGGDAGAVPRRFGERLQFGQHG